MAVVPRDEFCGRITALQIFTGNAHVPIGLGARREKNLVVVLFEIGQFYIAAELHIAEETKTRIGGNALKYLGDGLDLQVIGRDAVAHQAERHRQFVEHIDLDGKLLLLEQMLGGVKRRRA